MRVFAKVRFPLRHHWRPLVLLLLCAAAGLVQAQSTADDNSADPPSRVARLAYIEGDLGFLPAGATTWSDASINRPLTTGDRLSTGQDARAELELGGGTLRMAGGTDFGLLNLDDQMAQLELTQGTLGITVRHLDDGQSYEIDTPTVALVIDRPGTFRVDIDDNGHGTQVTALDGNATVYGEDKAQRTINAGRSYRFDDSSLSSVAISDIGGGDGFDAWCNNRDNRYAQSASQQYVSDDVVGNQDLDQYGDWETTSDYGAVWYPSNVGSDWAPYRDGRWVYIAPWGWSWIDDARWGFAPYHYGRWAYTHRGWGWIPGPIGVRPIYAPALVAFVGGGGWAGGIGGGPVGWFPLGPGEIYNPWYRVSRRYYGNVNITNIRAAGIHNHSTIINSINGHYSRYRAGAPSRDEHYVNRNAPRGFTAVPGSTFAGGRRVQGSLLHVDQRQLAAAPVLSRGTGLRPAADNPATPRSAHVRSLPVGGFQRNVVARRTPPVAAADRHNGFGNNLASPQRAGSNVHVLSQHIGNAPGNGQSGLDRADSGRIVQDGPRRSGDTRVGTQHNLPPTSNVISDAPVVMRGDGAVPARSGPLPSARFAHPQADGDTSRRGTNLREPAPRPGVSYISNADENASRANDRGTSTLPQVPQIQRATPIGQPVRDNEQRAQRFERADNSVPATEMRTPPRQMPEPASQNYAPRYQQREPARAMPPQYAPQQQRPEMTRPPQREAQPRAEPRENAHPVRKDDQQH